MGIIKSWLVGIMKTFCTSQPPLMSPDIAVREIPWVTVLRRTVPHGRVRGGIREYVVLDGLCDVHTCLLPLLGRDLEIVLRAVQSYAVQSLPGIALAIGLLRKLSISSAFVSCQFHEQV